MLPVPASVTPQASQQCPASEVHSGSHQAAITMHIPPPTTQLPEQAETWTAPGEAVQPGLPAAEVTAATSQPKEASQVEAGASPASASQATAVHTPILSTGLLTSSAGSVAPMSHRQLTTTEDLQSAKLDEPPAALTMAPVITTAQAATAAAAEAVNAPRASAPSSAEGGLARPQLSKQPQAKAAQTAAEMLQWLDAALAGNKPAAGAPIHPKVPFPGLL